MDVEIPTIDDLRIGITEAIRATPVGRSSHWRHGPLTIEIYGVARARPHLPDPTGEIWLHTPERHEHRHCADITWHGLHALAVEMIEEWRASVTTALSVLRDRHNALHQAEIEVTRRRHARDETVVRLTQLGVPAARIAAGLPGMHRSTVGRVLERRNMKPVDD